jgi:DNA-binding NtrC family response regulator
LQDHDVMQHQSPPLPQTLVLVGPGREWPDGLDEDLRRSGFSTTHADTVRQVELLALHRDVRAIVVDARTLDFADAAILHRLRAHAPHVEVVVVGIAAVSESLRHALDHEATAFMARSELPARLVSVLRSHRPARSHA